MDLISSQAQQQVTSCPTSPFNCAIDHLIDSQVQDNESLLVSPCPKSSGLQSLDLERLLAAADHVDWTLPSSATSPAACSAVSFDSFESTDFVETCDLDQSPCESPRTCTVAEDEPYQFDLNWTVDCAIGDEQSEVEQVAFSMDMDPMATLFAFNSNCNSPRPPCHWTSSRVASSTGDLINLQPKQVTLVSDPNKGSGNTHHVDSQGPTSISSQDVRHEQQPMYQANGYLKSTTPHAYNGSSCAYSGQPGQPTGTGGHYYGQHHSATHSPHSGHSSNVNSYGQQPLSPHTSYVTNHSHGYPVYPTSGTSGPASHCPSTGHANNYQLPEHQLPSNSGHSFPSGTSMSVNLSMNMTMGFTASAVNDPTSIHWSIPPGSGGHACSPNGYPVSPSNYHHGQMHGHHIPSAGGYPSPPPSYTITAEFRPSGDSSASLSGQLPPIDKEFPNVCALRSHSPGQGTCLPTSGVHGGGSSHYPLRETSSRHARKVASATSATSSHKRNCSEQSNSHKLISSPLSSLDEQQGLTANLCRICGKTYARPSTLKTHLRTHSGERPYRCNVCNKSFSQAANLTAHIRTHSGEKPFMCLVCDRRFSQSSSVTTHMRTHSGERPYRCCLCKKAFSDSSTLTKHLRIHSGEKPYQCKLCLLRFSQSGNLNRHMRIHSGLG